MKKIVVTGASTYGVRNMGDDAMLATLVQGLQEHCPGSEITFLARHPDADYDKAFGFHSIKNLDHDTKEASAGRFFLGMNNGDDVATLVSIKEKIDDADLLIIGGNSLMEISPNEFLRGVSSYSATLATLAKFCGTPFALFGMNVVDSIKADTTRQHARFLVENAVAVTMREENGVNYIRNLGIGDENISVCGDPAFGIKVMPNQSQAASLLSELGISLKDGPVIGVGVRHEYWQGSENEYADRNKLLAGQLDKLVSTLNAQVLFIPNCTYTLAHPWQDDRKTHKAIWDVMSQKEKAHRVEAELSVFDTYSLFQLVDFHISNRRHSCAFAAMNYKPFLPLDVSLKGHMRPFVKELGLDTLHPGMDDLSCLASRVQKLWSEQDEIIRILHRVIPGQIDLARQHVPVILESVN